MIIVRITMGLGNQMFQYASALALSLEKNVPLKVDISSYTGYQLRKYELEKFFSIETPVATKAEIESLRYDHVFIKAWNKIFPKKKIRVLGLPYEEPQPQRSLLAFYDAIFPPHKRTMYTERFYHYDKNFFHSPGNVYLQGYRMSWKYFEKYRTAIKTAFTIRTELVAHLQHIAGEIQSRKSIGIHIRRTDITDPAVVKLKGILPVTYYINGIAYIQNKTGADTVYCFSDDIQWVKENIQVAGMHMHYVDNTSSAIEDFYLMTCCHHLVIANSTFSWWAAYLNNHTDKIIVAPAEWYAAGVHYNYKDVYPNEWIKMAV